MEKIGIKKKKDEEYRILLLKAKHTYSNTDKEFVRKFQEIVVFYSTIQKRVLQYEDIPGFDKELLKMDLKEYEQFYNDLCLWNAKPKEVVAPKAPVQKEELKEPKIEVKKAEEIKKEGVMTIQNAEHVKSINPQGEQAPEQKSLPSLIKEGMPLDVKEQKIIESINISQEHKSSASVGDSAVSKSGSSITESVSSEIKKSEDLSTIKP